MRGYEELVEALRETRETVRENPGLAMRVPPYQLSAAADAIEELVGSVERYRALAAREQDEPEMAGYSVKELIAFAELCRSQGVGPDEMHQSLRDAGKVADLIWAEVQKRMYEAVHQTAAQLTGEDTALIDKVMSYTKEAPET